MEGLLGRFPQLVINPQTVRRNFAIAMPELTESQLQALVKDVGRGFGRVLGELPHLQSFQKNRHGASLVLHNAPPPDLIDAGPVILIGAHAGNWEVNCAAFAMLGRPVVTVYSVLGEPAADREMTRMRTATGQEMVERQVAVRACMRALQQGKNVAMLVDHRVKSGHVVPFFGREAIFSHLPARLAIRFGHPIISASQKRLGRIAYEVRFSAPIYPDKNLSPERAEWDLTARMAAAIEATIRANPSDWFCATRRWPHDMM